MSVSKLSDGVFAQLHNLNNEHATELSYKTVRGFRALFEMAYWARHIQGRAFCIAFDHRSLVTSENFDFVAEHFDNFVYVDRIVVSEQARGLGYGNELYDALRRHAKQDGHKQIICEVNVDPPNPGSVKFHERYGFEPILDARKLENGKTVQYYKLAL